MLITIQLLSWLSGGRTLGYADELTPVMRPIRTQTHAPHYWRETSYRSDERQDVERLARAIRADLAEAKSGGRLPPGLRTLVSLRRGYTPRVSVTVRGLAGDEVFDEKPINDAQIRLASGVSPGDRVTSRWVMKRDWAFVFLQVYLIADGFNLSSYDFGSDYPKSRYDLDLYVNDVGFLSLGHLMSIVDS